MAFTIEGYAVRERKDDPRFVKWNVRFFGVRNGEAFEEWLPYHKCTEADYAEFSPLDPKSQTTYDSMVADEDRGFFCIDWNDEMKIYGRESASEYQRIDFGFVPCNTMATEVGVVPFEMPPECIEDLEA